MPVDTQHTVETRIVSLIRDVSGRKTIHPEQMIMKDVGVYGWDGILLAEKIEEMFDLDLEPLIESNTTFLPATWWDRLRGRTHGARYTDMKIKDLVEYVAAHAGEGQSQSNPKFF